MSSKPALFLALAVMGAGWGITQPLSKIAVSTGREPFGLIFWQFLAGTLLLWVIQIIRRRPFPMHRAAWRVYVMIALLGTLIPNAASFMAYAHVPAGIMSILISTVPMAAFAISLMIGSDRFSWARFGGLALGLVGIVLIIAPDGGLPDRVGGALGAAGSGGADLLCDRGELRRPDRHGGAGRHSGADGRLCGGARDVAATGNRVGAVFLAGHGPVSTAPCWQAR